MTVEEYISKYPSYKNEIESINTLFVSFGMHVDEVAKGAQIIRYKLLLPVDIQAQDKIRKSEKSIEYAISAAIDTDDFIYAKAGKYVYIEKKAKDFEPVFFENYIENLPTMGLYLLLGKDIDGHIMYTNLSKAPHILVAGTTGSGKSELLHTFIASLVTRNYFNPCQLYIIDPKIAEYSMYKNRKGITLITETSDAVEELKKACDTMDKRYRELESHGYKDISQSHDLGMKPIVFIIDELKDLMMQNKQVEQYIVRIAQKARGCGIHLIIGTQSPRADVVTGAIKANIPVKIALHTTTKIESRIILDQNGAENLVGRGDMLFLGNGAIEPIRIQSAYVKYKEDIADLLPYEEKKKVEEKSECPIDLSRRFRLTSDGMGWYYLDEPNKEYHEYICDNGKSFVQCTPRQIEPVQQTPQPTYTVVGNRILYNDNANQRPTYRVDGNCIIYYGNNPTPKRKHVGLIQTLINLMKVKPLMFVSSEYPPRIGNDIKFK